MIVDSDNDLERQIAEWRAYMHHRPELLHTDAEELEDHLRSRISDLIALQRRETSSHRAASASKAASRA